MTNEPSGPEVAYVSAPDIAAEIEWIARHAYTPPTDASAVREIRLREAAALDRIALQEEAARPSEVAAESIATAVQAAESLAAYDAKHGTLTYRGAELAGAEDFRAYVREEYRAWRHAQAS
ncbi:hypothetical protein [Streptomyces melanogenes]|uniref:hypothetical protein n=1 Tax=Streptomyces melanogenes TaxID=67326 RepID=UPI00167D914B|nr:hypothetical protein [Streptomyces melanogenes]GGP74709.1 hypothetical protein GCM10010278_61210 [Streptomyces melanogenes]